MILNGVCQLDSRYTARVQGVSYAGKPKDYTCLYISYKVKRLIENLRDIHGCIVFLENGVEVPESIREQNCYVMSDNPQRQYAEYVQRLDNQIKERDRHRRYALTEQGYFVGEGVRIGDNAYIEPGCLIGHNVVIGKNANIFAGARIKNAVIGDDFVAGENCVIGAFGFTMTEDQSGNKMRIPSIGKVIIGNNVEIGALTNISVGSAGETFISDNVKVDALVHIGHDALLMRNVEVTASSVIGGFVVANEGTFVGLNATLRNRIEIGENAIIGMGAVVTTNFPKELVIAGNPARILKENRKDK